MLMLYFPKKSLYMSQKVFLCFKIAQGEALFPRKDYFKQYYIAPT